MFTCIPSTVMSVAGPSTLCSDLGTPNSRHVARAVSRVWLHSVEDGPIEDDVIYVLPDELSAPVAYDPFVGVGDRCECLWC